MLRARDGGDAARAAAIETERQRRVALGHAWLTRDIAETPIEFRQVFADGIVARPDPLFVLGAPSAVGGGRVLTLAQFDEGLRAAGIPTVAMSTLAAMGGAGAGPPAASLAPGAVRPASGIGAVPFMVADPRTAPGTLRTIEVRVPLGWQQLTTPELFGEVPAPDVPDELRARLRTGGEAPITLEEARLLLERPMNANDRWATLIGFENGAPAPRALGSDVSTGRRGLSTAGFVFSEPGTGGVGRLLLAHRALESLRAGDRAIELSVGEGPRGARELADGSTTTDIVEFHRRLAARLGVEGEMTPGRHYWLNQRQAAQLALDAGAFTSAEEQALLARIAAGDEAAVAALRALPPPDPRVLLYRAQMASLGVDLDPSLMRNRLASPLTPELHAEFLHGRSGAAARSLGTGAGFGALLGLGLDATHTAATGGDWNAFGRRTPATLTVGGVGGGVGLGLEQLLVARSSTGLIEAGVAPGLASGMRLIGARLVGGGVGAGVAELVLIYGFEQHREHDVTREVMPRVARSTAIGAVSTGVGLAAQAGTVAIIGLILTSAGEGAVAGSVVPGWGTAIGAGVGLAVGIGTYLLLDSAVPRVEPVP
jgi:hypothetical protein